MAEKLRFAYSDLEVVAEGEIDTHGRKGLADVPVGFRMVLVRIRIATPEPDARLARLGELVARYCPVDSMLRLAVPDYQVVWERVDAPA
ncbi:MAG TPA: OsmC family protein [Chloroflexaceae bacterium]|nr:OsmC family protein [Chloroflexaceae bacterium]